MLELKKSPVIFNEGEHTYTLNGNRLSGVTQVIKDKVCPEEYADVPEEILAAAAERGHAVHSAIELFIKYGVVTDSDEFRAYQCEMNIREELTAPIESEYIVSDEKQYASGIDIVTYAGQKGGRECVYLIDTKTTSAHNVDYVTWQLSVYKYLFEKQNPDVDVAGIFVLWLRGNTHRLQELTPHTAEEAQALLYDDTFIPARSVQSGLAVTLDIQNQVKQYKMAMEEAKMQYDALAKGLEQLMEESGVKKFEGQIISITRKADSVRRTFDAKRFEKDHPEMYARYVKESKTKGGILIKIKE